MHHQAWDMAWDHGVEVTRTRDPAADTALGGGIVIAMRPPPLAGEARARGRRPERVNRYTEIHGDGHAALITSDYLSSSLCRRSANKPAP